VNSQNEVVKKVVITGGPCGGKSTGIAVLSQWLADRGYLAATVPEAATEFISNGLAPWVPWTKPYGFNKHLLRRILENERRFEEALRAMRSDKPRVLLCDRGAMDILAYTTMDEFLKLARSCRQSVPQLRDRYDGVIHLVSAAVGAEEHYTCANNTARTETVEQAAALDERTQKAWWGSGHIFLIDNVTDFTGKIERAKKALAHTLGIPVPLEIERKYLVKKFPFEWLNGLGAEKISINQHYLRPVEKDGRRISRRVRLRIQHGGFSCFYTEKEDVKPGVRLERERKITEREYVLLLSETQPGTHAVQKERYCFTYGDQYFEFDVFTGQLAGLAILEKELTEENQGVWVPEQFGQVQDVTGMPEFTNEALSRMTSVSA
jgi:CYTH domain-containing protein/predicted ATPase